MGKRQKHTYQTAGQVDLIPVEEILPNPQQPRREFDRIKLLELSNSIAEHGILQPLVITVRDGKPILLSGERRLRAAKMAGLKAVPCVRTEAEGLRQALLAMIENLQREDMNCFETAQGIARLIETYGLTQEEAALKLGYSQSAVANKLRLLRLTSEEQESIVRAGLTERHARCLLRLKKAEERQRALCEMVEKRMTVAQAERLVERILSGKTVRHRRAKPLIRDVRVFFNTLEHALATMKQGGVAAVSTRSETDTHIECVIRIPKATAEK